MNAGIMILSFFICLFNIIGLMFVMNDGLQVLEIYRGLEIKKKIICFFIISLITFLLDNNIDLVFFLIIEYFCILIYNKQNALWGINSILFVLLIEIGMLFYYRNLNNNGIQMITYLATALMEFFWVSFHRSRKLKKGFKKLMMILLEIMALENLVWLSICISNPGNMYIMIMLFVFLIFIYYIVFFIVSYKLFEKSEIETQSNTYEYYLQMEEEHRQIRKMYHDMKNHLMLMQTENHNDQYIQQTSKKLDDLHQFYHTGIHSLDILLFNCKMKAEEKGIKFEAIVSEGCLSFMKEEDINVIFSNAIKNAIEACEKIPGGGVLNR